MTINLLSKIPRVCDRLLEELNDFQNRLKQDDDVTLTAIRAAS